MMTIKQKKAENGKDKTNVKRKVGPMRQGPVAQYKEPDLLALQRAVANPAMATTPDILAVQRKVGNRAVVRWLKREMQRGIDDKPSNRESSEQLSSWTALARNLKGGANGRGAGVREAFGMTGEEAPAARLWLEQMSRRWSQATRKTRGAVDKAIPPPRESQGRNNDKTKPQGRTSKPSVKAALKLNKASRVQRQIIFIDTDTDLQGQAASIAAKKGENFWLPGEDPADIGADIKKSDPPHFGLFGHGKTGFWNTIRRRFGTPDSDLKRCRFGNRTPRQLVRLMRRTWQIPDETDRIDLYGCGTAAGVGDDTYAHEVGRRLIADGVKYGLTVTGTKGVTVPDLGREHGLILKSLDQGDPPADMDLDAETWRSIEYIQEN